MSALWRPRGGPQPMRLEPMTSRHLDAVMALETAAYPFPWTRGNFIDSLAAGYAASVLRGERGELLGYLVAMAGVEEVHLLNITVAPAAQGQGHAGILFADLLGTCRRLAARTLWLEVRQSNAHARAVYRHLGFVESGTRKGYYPAAGGKREDAVVMSLAVAPPSSDTGSDDALA